MCGATLIKHAKKYAKDVVGTPISSQPVKPKRKLSDKNKRERLRFCRRNRCASFAKVMFTDRVKFHLKHPGFPVVNGPWHLVGHPPEAHTVTHPVAFNVYGGITKKGPTRLHVITGTTNFHPVTQYKTKKGHNSRAITAHEYGDVLLKTILPEGHRLFRGADWTLQQDNDSSHVDAAKDAVKAWNMSLKEKQLAHGYVKLMKWPANSPDLSIIENVWSIIGSAIDAAGCKTNAEFQAKVEQEFAKIKTGPLFRSLPKRIKQCIKAKGDWTPH